MTTQRYSTFPQFMEAFRRYHLAGRVAEVSLTEAHWIIILRPAKG